MRTHVSKYCNGTNFSRMDLCPIFEAVLLPAGASKAEELLLDHMKCTGQPVSARTIAQSTKIHFSTSPP